MFNVAHINGGSIYNKLDEVRHIISNVPLHALCISETWYNDSHSGASINLSGYRLIRSDRDNSNKDRGGGVALYIRHNIKTTVKFRSKSSKIDILLVELKYDSNKLLLGVVYKPPDVYGYREIENILNNYHTLYTDIMILGDFNINVLDSNDSVTKAFVKYLDASSLSIVNSEPTHFSGKPSLIDYIITNNLSKILSWNQVTVSGISKHDLIYCSYKINPSDQKQEVHYFRSFKDLNLADLSNELCTINWDLVYSTPYVNDQIDIFNSMINNIFHKYVPLKKATPQNNINPLWFDNEIVKSLIERDLAYSHWKITRLESDHLNFKLLRNRAILIIRKKKRSYFNKKFPPGASSKELWHNLEQVGVHESRSASTTQLNPNDLLRYFSLTSSSNNTSVTKLKLPSKQFNFASFSFRHVTSTEVYYALNHIKSNALGLDNISIKFIKIIYPWIAGTLTYILNHIITTSSFPDEWKKGKIIPIPKAPIPSGPSDYRPVSILPALSKAIEKLMKDQITEYITENKLMDQYQSGFRKFHGATTALLQISHDLFMNLEQKYVTALVLLDFTKAFDTVPHLFLIEKLSKIFNFSPSALSLIESYLSERNQVVFSNNQYSDIMAVQKGVPQGSILGPLFFSLYINDLPIVLKHSKYHLYADDFQIYIPFKPENVGSGIAKLNVDLKSVYNWSITNGLTLNEHKTQYILVKHHNTTLRDPPNVKLNDTTIAYSNKVNDLGLIINHNLKWDDNTNKICSKVYCVLRKLWRFAKIIPYHVRYKLFLSLLLPHFTYASPVFANLNYNCSHTLKMAFHACVRFVFLLRKYDHISEYSIRLLKVPINMHLDILSLVFLFKILKHKKPEYLYSILQFCRSSRTVNLKVPKHVYLATGNSYFVHTIQLWNALPIEIKKSRTVAGFRRGCSSHFSKI